MLNETWLTHMLLYFI